EGKSDDPNSSQLSAYCLLPSAFLLRGRLELRIVHRHVELDVGELVRRRAGWRRGDDGEWDFDAIHIVVVHKVCLFGQRPQHALDEILPAQEQSRLRVEVEL